MPCSRNRVVNLPAPTVGTPPGGRWPRYGPGLRWCAVVAIVAIAAATLSVLAMSPAAAAAPPQGPPGDAFYTPPNPLPPGRPGDVIWQRKKSESAESTTYLVLYRSTSATGAPIAVSGMVIVPKTTPAAGIVGVAPGTTGLGDKCAVSRDDLIAGFVVPADLVRRGFALAVTDYEGLGTPGTHTYVVGRSEGHAVLDIVRAATRLGVGLSPTAPVGFWGYSQGGGGALWAAELAPTYAPELDVKGTAAGGTPADLVAVGQFLNGGLAFGFLAGAAAGLNAAYPELNLAKYLNPEGQRLLQQADALCAVDIIAQLAFKRITDYTTTDPMQQPDWQARLRENSLGGSPPKTPVLMYHGIVDQIVPYPQADALHQKYCPAGVKLTWSIHIGEHALTAISGMGESIAYITDRLRGVPATSNC